MLVKIKMRLDFISQKNTLSHLSNETRRQTRFLNHLRVKRSSLDIKYKQRSLRTSISNLIRSDTWDFFRLCEKSLSFIAVPIFICSFLSWRNPAAGRTNQSMAAMAACGWQGPTWAQGAGPFHLPCRPTRCGRRTRSARSESLRWTGFRATTTTTCWCRTCRICRRNRIRSFFLREPAEKVKVTKKTSCF